MILGPRSQMKRSEAREALEREITKQNGQTGDAGKVMNDGSVSFGWFVRNRFLPLKEANWKEETCKVKKLLIQKDLIDPFDKVPLENFDKFTLQVHLNNLAQTRSKDRVLQMRAYLRDIFVEAVDQDFLSKDPARKVKFNPTTRDQQNNAELGTTPKSAFPLGSSRSGPVGTRHDECPPSQRTVRAQMELLQPRRIHHERERNSLHGQDSPVGQNPKESRGYSYP